MKNKSIVLLAVVAMLLVANTIHAEESEIKPTGKFGEAVKKLREENQEQRKNMLEKNEEARELLKEQNKASREALLEENKGEREEFNEETKARLEGLSEAEKKALLPTIRAERKDLAEQNKEQRKVAIKAAWDSKKSLNDNIRTNMDTFRQSVRTSWTNLWSTWFTKK